MQVKEVAPIPIATAGFPLEFKSLKYKEK